MRVVTPIVAAAFAMLASDAFAQTDTSTGYPGAYAPAPTPGATPDRPPVGGVLPEIDTGPGLDKVGPDGSTKTVRAVPCSTAARETDGSTTCVGIPEEGAGQKKRR
jgi:hypothetical protein